MSLLPTEVQVIASASANRVAAYATPELNAYWQYRVIAAAVDTVEAATKDNQAIFVTKK